MDGIQVVTIALRVISDRLITILALLASSVMRGLDNVESFVGTGINTSDIRDIQLPFSKNEKKGIAMYDKLHKRPSDINQQPSEG